MNMEEIVPGRFITKYNQESGNFRILDTWHPTIKNLNLEENPIIPDDSQAVKVVTTEETNSIVDELMKIGWLDKIIESKIKDKEENPNFIHEKREIPKDTRSLIVEKITEITLDSGIREEPHSSVAKDAISALKEIASKL